MAYWIKSDLTIEAVEPKNGSDFSLEELQKFVGGTIELITLRRGYMVINDSGKLDNLPSNLVASLMYKYNVFQNDYICGDVLLCRQTEIE